MTKDLSSKFYTFAAPWVLRVEGGASNDPDDRGGATNHGVTLATLQGLPDADGDGFRDGDIDKDGDVDADDVNAQSQDSALEIYRRDFWLANHCEELPLPIALCMFDGAVNHGQGNGRRLVQRALGVEPDGAIGPVTLGAANNCDVNFFLSQYLSYRAEFYCDITKSDPSQNKFLRGWLRRLFLLQQTIYTDMVL